MKNVKYLLMILISGIALLNLSSHNVDNTIDTDQTLEINELRTDDGNDWGTIWQLPLD